MIANKAASNSTTPIQHIIACLSDPPRLDTLQTLKDEAWEEVAITAIAVGLAPLLHWRLEQAGLTPPPLTMAKLGVTRQAHAKRNAAIADQLAELLMACDQENLDVVVLKGALLAPTVYPDPALRPMNDIDLLFHPDDVVRAELLLERLGYVGKHKSADQGPGITKHLSTYRRAGDAGSTPNPYVSASGERMVEPHGSLEESWFGLRVDITPGIWHGVTPITLHDQPAHRLATVDLLLHLAVHATFHVIMGRAVFLQLYDLGQVLKTWGTDLNWHRLLARTTASEAEPFLYAALYWAKTIFNTPIPDPSLTDLQYRCPDNLVAYIHAVDVATIFERIQQPPLASLPQRLQRGLQDRREAARWATSATEKWKVWQTALAFHKTDTVQSLSEKIKV